ncbi:hypothetical protein KUW17_13565 [Leisingera aquaemixtae]|uniref:hypothetical protein n=1 Tax=Leisingera aquaemixtae TaxID=1396826 RepID=UPI001C9556B2|nr:hypothetical protein [Leisingera aquaemixtae]MBY6067779.1 hypothetical protein [Leisingera aquaemixtae]
MSPNYFVVTCHGWSASNWLAHALHKHKDVTCAHSSALIPAKNASVFDGRGLQKHIPDLRKGYVERQTRSLMDTYADFSKDQQTEFVGSVHSYRLRDLPAQTRLIGQTETTIPVVNLVRHPLDLVVSGYGQFKDLFPIDLNEFSWTLRKIVDQGLDIAETVCKRHSINPGDFDTVCFLGACVVLGSLRMDLDALNEVSESDTGPWDYRGIVRMEEVTRDRKTYAELLDRLSNHKLQADTEYLESVFEEKRVNVHNRSAPEGTAARWQALQPWQREAFKAYLALFQLQSAYESNGYDFSFLEET